jgi:hypothetical protein
MEDVALLVSEAQPKSAIFREPSAVNNKFSGLMSLCKMLFA